VGSLLVGVDIGGTFTDCVVLDRGGRIIATKSPSTLGNFAEGMLAAMRAAAARLGLTFDVIPDFSSVMLWSPISTRGDRTNEEALFGRADHRVSAGG
jgi:N-methylhydantoinase A